MSVSQPKILCTLSGGEFRSTSLAAILIEALRGRVTGELVIGASGGTSRVFLRDGQPCGVQIFFGFKPLGQFLLELGWIDIRALERSLLAVADGRKQGEALVSLGFLTPEQLASGLALLHRGHLRTLSGLSEGSYAFHAKDELPSWTDEIRIGAHRAILDALLTAGGRKTSRQILQGVPPEQRLRLRKGWITFARYFDLDPQEQVFVARLQEPQRLYDLLSDPEIGESRAAAVIAIFLLMGVALPHREAPSPASVAAPPSEESRLRSRFEEERRKEEADESVESAPLDRSVR